MAETYGIFDMFSYKPSLIADFFAGLGEDSRTVRAMTGRNYDAKTLMLASIADGVNLLHWRLSNGEAQRPASFVMALTGQPETKEEVGFASPDEFEAALKALRVGEDG